MARVSTKQNKNIYHTTRESLQLTREEASELLEAITPERIEKIENERTLPHPDEVLLMAEKYKQPGLCNYYCANQCPIGQQYVPEVKIKDLSQIVLEMLASLNSMQKRRSASLRSRLTVRSLMTNWRISSTSRKNWSGSPSLWRRFSCGQSECWQQGKLIRSSIGFRKKSIVKHKPILLPAENCTF